MNNEPSLIITGILGIATIIIAYIVIVFVVLPHESALFYDENTLIKEGMVIKIKSGVVFGASFTDWCDDIYFNDGTVLSSQDRDLSSIRLNENGTFYFEKNYFEYDGSSYKFDNFIKVEYYDCEC